MSAVTDWGQLYRDNVAALGALADGLSEEQLRTRVPPDQGGPPGTWTNGPVRRSPH